MPKNFHKILNIHKTATQDEIKKAYHKLAKIHHPDKGGDPELFKQIKNAYEYLTDNNKTIDQEDIETSKFTMQQLFNTFGTTLTINPTNSHKTYILKLDVTLKELYTESEKIIPLIRKLPCKDCKGSKGTPEKCTDCENGITSTETKKQKFFYPCDTCNTKGFTITDICKSCKGEGTFKKNQNLILKLTRCMSNNTRQLFKQGGDQFHVDYPADDIIITLSEQPDKKFKRNKDNLIVDHEITLYQALTGFDYSITHIDGEEIKISVNQIIQSGDIQQINGKGMGKKGNLHVRFKVIFPKTLIESKDLLREMLTEDLTKKQLVIHNQDKDENKDEDKNEN